MVLVLEPAHSQESRVFHAAPVDVIVGSLDLFSQVTYLEAGLDQEKERGSVVGSDNVDKESETLVLLLHLFLATFEATFYYSTKICSDSDLKFGDNGDLEV